MYLGKTVAVVVPCHNEERFVGGVIETLPEAVDRAYVVDDCSTDGTWDEIREHARRANEAHAAARESADTTARTRRPAGTDGESEAAEAARAISDGGVRFDDLVVPIRHETNLGRGAAVKTGYRAALADGVDVVAVMDGDGQMDPDIFEDIVDPVARGEADYAVGNRLSGPEGWRDMPPFRLFGNVLLTGLTCIASGYWHVRDPQNGYTAVSSEALDVVDFESLYDEYGFLNEMLVRLNVADLPVVNVSMNARYGDEESGISYRTFIPKLSTLLLRDFLWRLWRKYLPSGNPVAISYLVGALVTFLGLVGALVSVLKRSDAGRWSLREAAVGVVCLVTAMVLDSRESERRGLRGKRRD